MKKLTTLFTIIFIFCSFASFSQVTGSITKRDTALYAKPLGYRIGLHADNNLYFWDRVRYRRADLGTYKVWTADVTQTSTSAPTWTGFDTTGIPNVVWTRDSAGSYKATATGKFTLNKTAVFVSTPAIVSDVPGTISVVEKTANFIRIVTTRNDTGARTDAYLSGTSVEFRVYW